MAKPRFFHLRVRLSDKQLKVLTDRVLMILDLAQLKKTTREDLRRLLEEQLQELNFGDE